MHPDRRRVIGPQELLRLLDLDGVDPVATTAGEPLLTPSAAPDPAASPTALELDGWSVRRGDELLADSPRLRDRDVTTHAAADFLAAAFLPDPRLAHACSDPLRHLFVAQLLETPDYRSLHAATALCDPASTVAAIAFAEQYAAFRDDRAGLPADDPADLEMAALRAAARAAAEAGGELAGLGDALAAMGLGDGGTGSADPRAVAALFRRVRADPTLRRICELAGRFRRVAQSRQRMKAAHGVDEVVGVTLGGDVGSLLASELARLTIPELELDALRRIAERAALCRELRAVEPAGRGPVIVVVDESGSMQGGKVETAKALALAIAWVARKQRRWVGLVAYSGDSGERLLCLPPGRWDERKVTEWVAAFIGRGSTLDVPINELPEYHRWLEAPKGITDVVIVTDAACRIPADARDRFLAWKREAKARVTSLVLGTTPGDLVGVSDECHTVAALDPDAPAVGRVLST